jgi:hypothetical protein
MLRLAIVRTDDKGKIDKVLLEHDVKDFVAGEVERELRFYQGKKTAARIVRDAFALAEERIRSDTSRL